MSTDSVPNSSPSTSRVRVSDMNNDNSAVWEWGDLLDFSLDDADPLNLPWDPSEDLQLYPLSPPHPPLPSTEEEAAAGSPSQTKIAGKVRKRDPRLVCENFLHGRVPCECPEVDEMMLREEEAGGRKRVRTKGAVAATATVRCQVPGCEVDIRELKGYHRRHRVCLRCAVAPSVVIEGEDRRYCQQCGK